MHQVEGDLLLQQGNEDALRVLQSRGGGGLLGSSAAALRALAVRCGWRYDHAGGAAGGRASRQGAKSPLSELPASACLTGQRV